MNLSLLHEGKGKDLEYSPQNYHPSKISLPNYISIDRCVALVFLLSLMMEVGGATSSILMEVGGAT